MNRERTRTGQAAPAASEGAANAASPGYDERSRDGESASTAAAGGDGAVDRNAVETRAYEIYSARGFEHGRDMDDWLEAEAQLRNERTADSQTR